MAGTVSEQAIAQYGQDDTLSSSLVAKFGYELFNDDTIIPDLADRAVSLLIEQLRTQYGAG